MKWFFIFSILSLSTLLVIRPVKVELNQVQALPQEGMRIDAEKLRRENQMLHRMLKQCDSYDTKVIKRW
jgi:hypothetical protein